ncbi:helix-turn-helix domain-containing protein [Pseudomonas sp. CFSAN084952]|uniref:AraC family transcriptional regulator n=1 Tax=Pseudomonas TaxID=286 RepID=UPI001299AD73|nr:AraC family transcriptional regulator [Pseudomonas sp. CFSAN084952]QGF93004.1 helix-turn-helix domain-containing protein [Pseudomonas sp. CFSAN084952]
MADICGPHQLRAYRPEQVSFQHRGYVFGMLSTTLGKLSYGTDVTVTVGGEQSLSCYSLTLPVIGEQELAINGCRLHSDRDYAVILSPFEHQELSISGNCSELHVALPLFSVQSVLAELLQRSVDQPIVFESRMDAVNGGAGAWWRMVRYFLDEIEHGQALYGNLLFNRDLESALIKGLILAQPNNYTEELQRVHTDKPPHYLLRAKAFIHANAKEDLYLEDIESAAGVSRIKLFEGFRSYFGSTPVAYLRKYRLLAIRQQILEDRSARNVSPIALEWGLNHLGRFSSDYRKLFGETPRMTLMRANGRADRLC